MKQISILFIALFAFSTAAFSAKTEAPVFAQTGFIAQLQAGTVVLLESTERIGSDRVTVGKTLMFRVKADVVVNGFVVVATGAFAIGRVKNIEETTFNDPAEVTLEVISVQAVNGQQVPLMGAEQIFKGRFKNEEAVVEPGQMMTAMVTNNTEIIKW